MGKELGELAEAYLAHYRRTAAKRDVGLQPNYEEPGFDAFEKVQAIWLERDIESLWEVNIELIQRCRSLDELGYVAAGPIEDMLNLLPDRDIDAVLTKANRDPRWRYAIAGTYTSRMAPRLAAAIERIQRASTPDQRGAATGLA